MNYHTKSKGSKAKNQKNSTGGTQKARSSNRTKLVKFHSRSSKKEKDNLRKLRFVLGINDGQYCEYSGIYCVTPRFSVSKLQLETAENSSMHEYLYELPRSGSLKDWIRRASKKQKQILVSFFKGLSYSIHCKLHEIKQNFEKHQKLHKLMDKLHLRRAFNDYVDLIVRKLQFELVT